MIKAVLADLDGTLAEAKEIHFDALNMALKEVSGFEISKEEEEYFNALTTVQKLELLSSQNKVKKEDHKLIWTKKQEYTKDAIIKNLSFDPAKVKLLKYIRSLGIRIACVTNSITETAELMLKQTGQFEYFDLLITNQMISYPKPHGEGYIVAMVRLKSEPKESLIIEDSEKGLISAYSTGAHVWKVNNPNDVTLDNFVKQLNKYEKS